MVASVEKEHPTSPTPSSKTLAEYTFIKTQTDSAFGVFESRLEWKSLLTVLVSSWLLAEDFRSEGMSNAAMTTLPVRCPMMSNVYIYVVFMW